MILVQAENNLQLKIKVYTFKLNNSVASQFLHKVHVKKNF